MKTARLQREVASALVQNALPSTIDRNPDANVLVGLAKRLQRFQTRRAAIRKELRRLDREIKATKRMLREVKQGV